MVNQTVLDYLKRYKSQFKLEDLKKKILTAGYKEEDFEEAVIVLDLKKVEPKKEVKPFPISEKSDEEIKKMPHPHKLRWIKFAAICGILVFVFSVIGGISSNFNLRFAGIFYLLSQVSLLLFFSGFIALGKKYDKTLIKVSSWIIIALNLLLLIFLILLIIFPNIGLNFVNNYFEGSSTELSAPLEYGSTQAITDSLANVIYSLLFLVIGIVLAVWLIYMTVGILFGIGLIKLKENVKLAKLTGILIIVGSVLMIIGLGVLLLFAAMILGIIILFKESKEKEEGVKLL